MLIFLVFSLFFTTSEALKCYSCASNNMKENFLQKQRGPPNRIGIPKVFSDDCHSSTWVIKDRSSDDCGPNGFCFKWSQALNNSGSYSYMTFRGCYSKLYNTNDPNSFQPPSNSFCTASTAPLACLSDVNVAEDSCWCQGDYCNNSPKNQQILSIFTFFTILLCF